ncbi:MAG: thioredoxin fold domain-containing protein [Gammaproteobacteria bacterium]|nr:thioredoxin fold domain-containing protein [Gammaproteobacteria bacterium]
MQLPIQRSWLAFMFSSIFLFAGNATAEEKEGKFLGAAETEYPAWFKDSFLDLREDLADADKAGRRMVVLFVQNGCPYCHALIERNLAQKDIEQVMRKNFDVILINMWGDREVHGLDGKRTTEKDLAAALKVQFTPTLLFFNEKGDVVLRLNGYLPPHRFKHAIEYVANRQENKISYRDYMAANASHNKSSKLRDESFFARPPYDLRTLKGKKPVALFFEQNDCPNCDMLHDKVLIDDSVRKVVSQFENIQLDMWSKTPIITMDGKQTTAKELAKQLDVKYAPTIVLLNADGKEVIRSEAFFKVFHTRGIFAYVLEGGYKTQPSFQRWLQGYADHLREQGQDVDIWRMGDDKSDVN